MLRTSTMPGWLTVVLVIVGLAVLGPPALVLLVAALALLFSLGVLALKVGVVVLLLMGVVALIKAVFGGPSPAVRAAAVPAPAPRSSLDDVEAQLAREERERRAELDRQLDLAVQQAR